MGTRSEVIEDLTSGLGSEVYVFAPDDSRFFLSEIAMAGIAVTLVNAFLKGLLSGAQKGLEAWGKSCADWLVERVAFIARNGSAPSQDLEELDAVTQEVAEDGAATYSDAVVVVLVSVFQGQGMTQEQATRTAKKVAVAADALVSAASEGRP